MPETTTPEVTTDFTTNLIRHVNGPNFLDLLGAFSAGVGGGIAKLTATGEKSCWGRLLRILLLIQSFTFLPAI